MSYYNSVVISESHLYKVIELAKKYKITVASDCIAGLNNIEVSDMYANFSYIPIYYDLHGLRANKAKQAVADIIFTMKELLVPDYIIMYGTGEGVVGEIVRKRIRQDSSLIGFFNLIYFEKDYENIPHPELRPLRMHDPYGYKKNQCIPVPKPWIHVSYEDGLLEPWYSKSQDRFKFHCHKGYSGNDIYEYIDAFHYIRNSTMKKYQDIWNCTLKKIPEKSLNYWIEKLPYLKSESIRKYRIGTMYDILDHDPGFSLGCMSNKISMGILYDISIFMRSLAGMITDCRKAKLYKISRTNKMDRLDWYIKHNLYLDRIIIDDTVRSEIIKGTFNKPHNGGLLCHVATLSLKEKDFLELAKKFNNKDEVEQLDYLIGDEAASYFKSELLNICKEIFLKLEVITKVGCSIIKEKHFFKIDQYHRVFYQYLDYDSPFMKYWNGLSREERNYFHEMSPYNYYDDLISDDEPLKYPVFCEDIFNDLYMKLETELQDVNDDHIKIQLDIKNCDCLIDYIKQDEGQKIKVNTSKSSVQNLSYIDSIIQATEEYLRGEIDESVFQPDDEFHVKNGLNRFFRDESLHKKQYIERRSLFLRSESITNVTEARGAITGGYEKIVYEEEARGFMNSGIPKDPEEWQGAILDWITGGTSEIYSNDQYILHAYKKSFESYDKGKIRRIIERVIENSNYDFDDDIVNVFSMQTELELDNYVFDQCEEATVGAEEIKKLIANVAEAKSRIRRTN